MEYSTDSSDIVKSKDNFSLKDLFDSTLLTDNGPDTNKSECDPNMEMSCPLIDQTTKKRNETDSSYTVTFTVSIAMAIHKEEDEELVITTVKGNNVPKHDASNGIVEAPRAQGYYCIEYNILPDNPEPIRVDLVMFGLAAKIYMKNETKVLKPWRDGNQVWVSWFQTLKVNVTRELLIKMASHKITVRVWDSKDKVSFRARNDRPKAFRLPQGRSEEQPDQMGGIKKMVCKLRAIYESENLRTSTSMKHQRDPISTDCKKNSDLTFPDKGASAKVKSLTVPAEKSFQKPSQEKADLQQKNEAASCELSVSRLLAGNMTLSACLGFCSGGVNEGFWNITLDRPLISEQLKADLNPLVITILSASSLPSSPVPFHVLKAKCHPVYCQYKFIDMPMYTTKGHNHNANIYFYDVNVIFTGLLSPGKLREFLRGPHLEIEVHDRDKNPEKPYKPPAVFGTDHNDDKLATVDLRTAKRTELHDSYGIAKLDLSELLQGHKYLRLKLPIRCSASDQNEWGTRILQTGSSDVLSNTPMPKGHYFEADSQLKVQVEIACPLDLKDDWSMEEECPFGRIIYVFRYNNTSVLAKLRSEILQINAEAFQLHGYPKETIHRVLSGHKISTKERENKNMNVLTGFHMMDRALHLFVLEGLKAQAVKRLWTTVPIKLDRDVEEQVTVLYNSDFSFSERLYDTLDVGLSPIHLLKPIETIMKEPLVFIRNMVPHTCLEAMKRISQLCQMKSLKDVVRQNLFPSANMVLALSVEFGLVLGRGELRLVTETQESDDVPDHYHVKKRTHTPLDNSNQEYVQWKQLQGHNMKDFIQANIEDVHRASSNVQKSKPIVGYVTDRQEDKSCIVQMNSTAQDRELQHRAMVKDFTCIPFTYPGFKSSIESNQHPKQPDDPRIEELRKPWRENVLHGNKLKPTLSRSRLPWTQRFQDFELYSKPPSTFGTELPLSIHLAGESLHEEQAQAAHVQFNRWLRKMLLDQTSGGSGRVPEFKCHTRAGLDKLQDILKDKPIKYSLRKPGMTLKPIPVISVVQHTEMTGSVEREANIPLAPGPLQNHSLSWDKNTIPRHSSQYNKFQFREYWRPHSFLHKRGVLPLTDEERRIYFSQKPPSHVQKPTASNTTSHIIELRTNKDFTLHVH